MKKITFHVNDDVYFFLSKVALDEGKLNVNQFLQFVFNRIIELKNDKRGIIHGVGGTDWKTFDIIFDFYDDE